MRTASDLNAQQLEKIRGLNAHAIGRPGWSDAAIVVAAAVNGSGSGTEYRAVMAEVGGFLAVHRTIGNTSRRPLYTLTHLLTGAEIRQSDDQAGLKELADQLDAAADWSFTSVAGALAILPRVWPILAAFQAPPRGGRVMTADAGARITRSMGAAALVLEPHPSRLDRMVAVIEALDGERRYAPLVVTHEDAVDLGFDAAGQHFTDLEAAAAWLSGRYRRPCAGAA